jgi:C4-dicarboxylate transporter DctM subunit
MAVMLTVNIEIGVIHPPIGLNLIAVSGVTGVSVGSMALRILPFIGVLLLMLALVTYGPLVGLTWVH